MSETPVAHQPGEQPVLVQRATLMAAAPADWFFKEQITFLAPDGQANVIASTEPLDPSIDVEKYTTIQGDLLRDEFPGFREMTFAEIGIDGIPGQTYFREFAWTPPDGVEVSQMQIYAVANGRGITATGTTPTTSFERYREALGEIILTLVHTPRPLSQVGGDVAPEPRP